MSNLKQAATRAAVLEALAKQIGEELKTAKADLEAELRAAKAATGTKTATVSLPGGTEVGQITLVQPAAKAEVVDAAAFARWAQEVAPGEVERRFVTTVRAAWQAAVLKQVTAVGTDAPQWADPGTGEVHEVPGVAVRGRAAYTRLTLPDEGREAIAAAWRSGALAGLALPQITAAPVADGRTEAAA